MAGVSTDVWPFEDTNARYVNINEHTFLITPEGKDDNGKFNTFIIKAPSDDDDDETLKRGLTDIERTRVCKLTFDDGVTLNDILVERNANNSSGLGGSYSLSKLQVEGAAAKRGGKSVRRHYRKRKSNRRRGSNKKYSASRGRRGRRSSGRTRKN